MNPFDRLAQYFGEFPGIGPRQAKRFVYFLISKNNGYIEDIRNLLSQIKNSIIICKRCYRYFQNQNNQKDLCSICENKNRDIDKVMIVSRDVDLETVEKSHAYNGMYFVLGGTIPILDKDPEKRVRLKEMIKRIDGDIKEIIISMSMTSDGENTEHYLKQYIKEKTNRNDIKITILGRGLSTGSEIEYLDSDTIKNALDNRRS